MLDKSLRQARYNSAIGRRQNGARPVRCGVDGGVDGLTARLPGCIRLSVDFLPASVPSLHFRWHFRW